MAGSSSDAPGSPTIDNPEELAEEAQETALAAFDRAADVDDMVERSRFEKEAATEFAESIAHAINAGYAEAHARTACGQLADFAEYYTKQALKDLVEEKREAVATDTDGRRPFDRVLQEDLNEVVIVRTTDAKQATIYRWQFDDGSVETEATAESRTHFNWHGFRDEYYDAIGEDAGKPTKERRGGEEWREFVVNLVAERGREVETRGPRSSAVDGLKNHIRRSVAYANIEDMVDREGLRLDAPPEDNPEELWIPNTEIKRIADGYNLESVRELQLELDARGYTRDRVQGVSESTFVNGDKVTYWVVDAGIAEPTAYVEEAEDPAAAVAREQADDEPAADEPEEYGSLGSVGGGDDE